MHVLQSPLVLIDNLQACTGNPPFSAVNAIAARADLNPANGNYTIPELGYGDSAASEDLDLICFATM